MNTLDIVISRKIGNPGFYVVQSRTSLQMLDKKFSNGIHTTVIGNLDRTA